MRSFVLKIYVFLNLLVWCIIPVSAETLAPKLKAQIKFMDAGSEKWSTKASQNAQARMNQDIQNLSSPLDIEKIKNFYQYSDENIKAGVAPFSYFSPLIDKQLIENKPLDWQVNYEVALNTAAQIQQINVKIEGEGKSEFALQNFLLKPPFKMGEPFISQVYDTYKSALLNTAQSLGYLHACFSLHQVLVDRAQHIVKVYLTLDTGPRYYFGSVQFAKNPLSDQFLKRFMLFKSGQPFSNNKVNGLQSDLQNSGYFSQVIVKPDLEHANSDRIIPIDVQLKPVPRRQYIFGLGYGTDTGARATLGTNWHYLNAYGHRFNAMLRLSQVQNTALAKYIIPGRQPLTDEYNINASIQNNNISQGESVLKQVGMGYTYSKNHWKYSFSLSEQIERYQFFNNPYQTSHLLLPGINVQHVRYNNVLFPTEGHRFSIKLIGAKQGIAADTNLIQGSLSEKWIHSFNSNNMILLRGDIGLTSLHDLNLLPLSLSFFAGGAQSIRGYGYNNLGPGRYLVIGSVEYRYRVYKKWYAATFFDVGNAFNNWPTAPHGGFQSNASALYHSLNQGAGVGVVWHSPIGAMELTYAKELNISGRPSRIQFNLGTDL